MRRVVVLFALAACGDDGGGIPLDDYATARRSADCDRLTRCGLFSAHDACERFFVGDLHRDYVAALDANKLGFDGTAAQQCLTAISAQSCDATSADGRGLPAICARVFTGRIADGDECAFDAECKSGSCDEPVCEINTCCAGTCEPTITAAATDAACHRDEDCADGYCGKDKLCHARAAVREMCTRDAECAFDLACIGATEIQPGLCRDLPLVGEQCPYQRCAELGATCVAGTCAMVNLAGATCASNADCSPYGHCAADGRCAELPVLGEQCTVGCADRAWCNNGTCAAPVGNMEPCGAGNQCESTYCEEGPVFDWCVTPVACS